MRGGWLCCSSLRFHRVRGREEEGGGLSDARRICDEASG